MKISIIISYYKALENLKLIFAGLERQSDKRFEVIISEDDNNEETKRFIEQIDGHYSFPIEHIHQKKDKGFRKNMMLNRAIKKARTNFLVFIDGDCVPARHFAKEYIKHARPGYMFWGRRVMLGQKKSASALKKESLRGLNFISTLFSDSQKIKEAIYSPNRPLSVSTRGLKGCNWGVSREHLLEVNGFDEDYVRAGVGEDNDIEWRLQKIGLQKFSMKNRAIVYHLFHYRTYSNRGVHENYRMFLDKQSKGHIKCLNGIKKIKVKDAVEYVSDATIS